MLEFLVCHHLLMFFVVIGVRFSLVSLYTVVGNSVSMVSAVGP